MTIGVGYHLHNILWSAATAYENRLLSRKKLVAELRAERELQE